MSRSSRKPGRARRRLLTITGTAVVTVSALVLTAVPAFACPPLTITASPTTVVAGNDTTLTLAATSNGNYTGAYIEVSSTGGPGTLTSFTTLGSAGCGGGVTSCAADGSYYKLKLPALTNGEKFSYTIDLTIDASTAAGTFTPQAEFFESNGTNIGPQTGPLITVTSPQANLVLTGTGSAGGSSLIQANYSLVNNGPGAAQNVTITSTMTPAGGSTAVELTDHDGDVTCNQTAANSIACTFETGSVTDGFDDPVSVLYTPSLLALGTYTITTTVSSTTPNPGPGSTTVTGTCTVLTGLIITCTGG
jgi:hypothetical protein